MNNDLLFDFNVDKAAKTITITREFDAELSLVWDAFTKQEILDQWLHERIHNHVKKPGRSVGHFIA